MLLTTVWMFWQDYAREYKSVQRTFRDVEATIAEREMIDKMPDPSLVREKREELRAARLDLDGKQRELAPEESKLKAKRETLDASYRTVKANFDAQMSYYNIAVEKVGEVPSESPRHASLQKAAEAEKEKLARIEDDLVKAKAKLDEVDYQINTEIRAPLEPLEKDVARKEEELK